MVVDYAHLDSSLIDTFQLLPGYAPEIVQCLQMLYLTGCRPVELMDSNRWYIDENEDVILITAKAGLLRRFSPVSLPVDFVIALQEGDWLFRYLRESQIVRYFDRLWIYRGARVGVKKVVLYSFRYRYVKSLVLAGYTPPEVQLIMGWNSVSLVSRYNDAVIIV